MVYKKVEGIVVSEFTYEESSKIIKIFSKDGIFSVICKGAKKIKSPFFGTTGKFTYGVFNILYKDIGLSKLVDADILNDYRNIKKDIVKSSYITYITELSLQVYKHEEKSNIYDLYMASMNKINEGYDPLVITDILRLKLLDNLGIKPVIDKCVVCGSTSDIASVSSYLGGFVCKNCLNNEPLVDIKTISLIRGLYYVDINKISKLDITDKIKKEMDTFINDYYDRYSGIYLKSKSILDNIK